MVNASPKNVLKIDREKVVELLRANKGNGYHALRAEFENVVIEEAMVMHRGNQTRAAEHLGLNRGTLRKKIDNLSN